MNVLEGRIDPSTVHTAAQAIHVLYHAVDANQRKQAEAWLHEAGTSDHGWALAVALLRTENAETKFFGATLIRRKAAACSQLSNLRGIRDSLCDLIVECATDRPDVAPCAAQLCSAVAIVAVTAAASEAEPCSSLLAPGVGGAAAALFRPSVNGEYTASAASLTVLAAMPVELESLDIPLSAKDGVRKEMAHMLPSLLRAVHEILLSTRRASPGAILDPTAPPQVKVMEIAAQCMSNWIPLGVSLSSLCAGPEPSLWTVLLHGLQHTTILSAVADCMLKALECNTTDPARPFARQALVAVTVALRPIFAAAAAGLDDAICHPIARLVAELTLADVENLSGAADASPLWAAHTEFLLNDVLQCPIKRIAEMVLPQFSVLEDLVFGEPPRLDCCPGLSSAVFQNMWLQLIRACAFEPLFSGWDQRYASLPRPVQVSSDWCLT